MHSCDEGGNVVEFSVLAGEGQKGTVKEGAWKSMSGFSDVGMRNIVSVGLGQC